MATYSVKFEFLLCNDVVKNIYIYSYCQYRRCLLSKGNQAHNVENDMKTANNNTDSSQFNSPFQCVLLCTFPMNYGAF